MRVHAWVYTRIAVPRAGSNNTRSKEHPQQPELAPPPGPSPRQLILRRSVHGRRGRTRLDSEETVNSNSNDEQPRRRDRLKAASGPTKSSPWPKPERFER